MDKRWLAVIIAFVLFTVTGVIPAAADTPEERVGAYHKALLDGDIEAARGMLAEDLLLFEDGLVETSLKEYSREHLKADIAFSENARRKLKHQTSWIDGDTAAVSTTYDLKTRYKGKRYHVESAETMILKRTEGQWVIVHVHWSNHQVME